MKAERILPDERGLEHVGQEAEDGVESFEAVLAGFPVLDSGEEFGEEGQIEDQGGGEEGVLRREERKTSSVH